MTGTRSVCRATGFVHDSLTPTAYPERDVYSLHAAVVAQLVI